MMENLVPVPSAQINFKLRIIQLTSAYSFLFIALFSDMRTLKYKGKLTITLYAAVNHYRNGHLKAEKS